MNKRIEALNGVRLVVSLFIVIGHLQGHIGVPAEVFGGLLRPQGVTAFIVLAGFVLTVAFGDLDERGDLQKFWVGRVASIWPAHLAVLAIMLALHAQGFGIGLQPGGVSLWANAFLFQSWIPRPEVFYGYNGVTWSLSAIFFLYFAFPFFLSALKRSWVPLIAGCIVSLWLAAISNSFPSVEVGSVSWVGIVNSPVFRATEFMLGIVSALIYIRTRDRFIFSIKIWVVVEIGALTLFLSAHQLILNFVVIPNWGSLGRSLSYFLTNSVAEGLSSALFILVLSLGKGPIAGFLASRPISYCGTMAFSIYLTHQVILYGMHKALDRQPGEFSLQWLCIYLFAVATASIALYYLVERPSKGAIMRMYRNFDSRGLARGESRVTD